MILYLDTSALVKRYFKEQHSETVISAWQDAAEIVISSVAYAETMAAFYRKKREPGLGDQTLAPIVDAFRLDWESLIRVAVTDDLNRKINSLVVSHPLKGFDAIHLASALIVQKRITEKLVFACFDQQLSTAAQKEGLEILPF